MADLSGLRAEVANQKTTIASMHALINGLADKVKAASGNQAELDSLVNELKASDADLAAAVAENNTDVVVSAGGAAPAASQAPASGTQLPSGAIPAGESGDGQSTADVAPSVAIPITPIPTMTPQEAGVQPPVQPTAPPADVAEANRQAMNPNPDAVNPNP